jgi:D-alanyl-lipoteichoic acid acyltransferase DltB (MBOAT superfamily)
MLFNSFDFAVFLPVVFVLYWFVANTKLRFQNALLAAAGCVFYGWWDWRFLTLMWFSIVLDYSVGIGLERLQQPRQRWWLLAFSLAINLGLLGFFKYYNFFTDQFCAAFTFFGYAIQPRTLNIILPVGISFYTFQSMGYAIDVYRRKQQPTHDFVAYAAFVSFFPQLAAGPIERAGNMLPQFTTPRRFDHAQAVDGLRQILWGLFKKAVVADNCATYVNDIFADPASHTGSTLLLGALFFSFQIYGDFSGYSDVAIGTARLFGIRLMTNFAYPYFSRDMAEFWRRWHISLSTWFRDYLYIPLGGSRGGRYMSIRNTTIVFLVSGFWHGANWTFIVWGALHALFFLPLLLLGHNRRHLDTVAAGRWLPNLRETIAMTITFALTTLAWVFFRAETVEQALLYLSGIFSASLFAPVTVFPETLFGMMALLVVIEWIGRAQPHALAQLGLRWPRPLRWTLYYVLAFLILLLCGEEQPFIYFQF